MVNLLPIDQEEHVTSVLPIKAFEANRFLLMVSNQGWIKKISVSHFESIRRSGLIATTLEEGDTLSWVMEASDKDTIFISTLYGMAIRFPIASLRPMGRTARGVTALSRRTGDSIISCDIIPDESSTTCDMLFVTNDGYGKRVNASEFRIQNRGGIGLISTKFKNEQSRVSATCVVTDDDEIMLVSQKGVVVRIESKDISKQGRMATGVRIMNMDADDVVSSVTKIKTLASIENDMQEARPQVFGSAGVIEDTSADKDDDTDLAPLDEEPML